MERIELLAPAGSMESLIAAINRGADAIYLGGSKFSARAYASNFDNETMEKAVDYAHTYGVKDFLNDPLMEIKIIWVWFSDGLPHVLVKTEAKVDRGSIPTLRSGDTDKSGKGR